MFRQFREVYRNLGKFPSLFELLGSSCSFEELNVLLKLDCSYITIQVSVFILGMSSSDGAPGP